MKKRQFFLSENFQCLEMTFSIYLNRRVFLMGKSKDGILSCVVLFVLAS